MSIGRCGAEGESVEISATPSKKSPLHVLVIDDEMLIRWAVSETLTHAGYEVTEASNAKEALERISNAPEPDVILLDYRLPDSNDLTLLERIRRIVPHSSVIMMTAYGTTEVVNGATNLGAFRILSKPVEMRELVRLVEQAYQSRPH
jgi:DNA-binding NtrC family response regulator